MEKLLLTGETAENVTTVKDFATCSTAERLELGKMWKHAGRIDANAIGWLPTQAFEQRAAVNEILGIWNNNDLVGWVLFAHSAARGIMKLYQIWVRPDARMLIHGKRLVDVVAERGKKLHTVRIEAWVAEDLDANMFWKAIGFVRTCWRFGKGRSTRKIFRWTHELEKNTWPTLAPLKRFSLSGENSTSLSVRS